jgi:hypothetical protein
MEKITQGKNLILRETQNLASGHTFFITKIKVSTFAQNLERFVKLVNYYCLVSPSYALLKCFFWEKTKIALLY